MMTTETRDKLCIKFFIRTKRKTDHKLYRTIGAFAELSTNL